MKEKLKKLLREHDEIDNQIHEIIRPIEEWLEQQHKRSTVCCEHVEFSAGGLSVKYWDGYGDNHMIIPWVFLENGFDHEGYMNNEKAERDALKLKRDKEELERLRAEVARLEKKMRTNE